jgi:tetratricopeptide (TPR) repeat protein
LRKPQYLSGVFFADSAHNMSTNDQKLIDDHKRVVETIRKYKNIFLISTTGDPPNEYDIEYKVRGYSKTTDGRVIISKHHRIKIKIPFGYPHFPPTIKPLSPIFHPEVDDYVVPIANYWEENKSLPDLVIRIGNMLCGNTFNKESAFNQEAVDYYQEHQKDLPLGSLQPVEKVKHQRDPIQFNFLVPVFKFVFFLSFLSVIGYGGLFLYEKLRLQQASAVLTRAEIYEVDRDFKKAQQTADNALQSLDHFYILQDSAEVLQKEIESFLKSKSLLEGLQGRIRYGSNYVSIESVQKIDFFRDLISEAEIFVKKQVYSQAIETYEKALDYAETNQLPVDRQNVRKILANLRFDTAISTAEEAHKNKNWDIAVENYQKALAVIDKHSKLLDTTAKQVESIRHTLLLDKIAALTLKAKEAEKDSDFANALSHHRALVDLIGKADSNDSTILKDALIYSMQQVAVLEERLRIQKQRQWLISNYKKIFQAHYPSVIPETLHSPQAIFVKYNDTNSVFDISCLEKGQTSVVKLRMYYQYNPQTGEWSIYEGDA